MLRRVEAAASVKFFGTLLGFSSGSLGEGANIRVATYALPTSVNATSPVAVLEVLQAMAGSVTGPHDAGEFLSALSEKLCAITGCDILIYSLHDHARQSVCDYLWQQGKLSTISRESSDPAMPVVEAWEVHQPVLVQDVRHEPGFPEAVQAANKAGMGSFCWLPLSASGQRIGALVFGNVRTHAFREDDLVFLSNVAKLVALTMENAQALETLRKEKDSLSRISGNLFSNQPLEKVLPALVDPIRNVVHQDFTCVLFYDDQARCLRRWALDFEIAGTDLESDECLPLEYFPYGQTLRDGQTKRYSLAEIREQNPALAGRMQKLGAQSLSVIPVMNHGGACGVLAVGSRQQNAFAMQDENFLQKVANQLATAIEHTSARQEIQALTEKLEGERVYLEGEISSSHNFEEIIGESPSLRRALAQVQTVAPTDATVLILGETGTGKELVARAIHRMSTRSDATFTKLNCAAIPTGLLESELFGHEKGAFTGAISQKVGRVELADKGTLFLDEVGDIPLELQPKLLRVLQDQEFERLGGTRTIRVNVRLIAATNRDLPKEVAGGRFRSDLFYRLHVFPVRLPPLRERTSDIPRLVRYFLQKSCRRMEKQIDTIPAEAMNALAAWHWPGNVRELENFVERSVLLSTGPVLNTPLAELRTENEELEHPSTLHSIEREHILRVLRETGGVIAGIHGAAARLGMKRTTLQSRMQRLGISRTEYEN